VARGEWRRRAPSPSRRVGWRAERTLTAWSEKFIASRIDIDANTTKNYRTALKKVGKTFGDRDPATITADEVAAWVAELAQTF
jgi:hypothetical protein